MFKRRKNDDLAVLDHIDPQPDSAAGPAPATATTVNTSAKADNGLGVPPFRPASPKESPAMGRAPYPVPTPPTPVGPVLPQAAPALRPVQGRNPNREPAERRTLIVGKGISLQGTVQDAERLVVQGTVEATMIQASELSIEAGGVFRGEVEVEDAEVAGTIDGTLTARGNLTVRATGRVLGTARCRRLQVEDGGQITGRIEMITEPPRVVEAEA